MSLIYKICSMTDWDEARKSGFFSGSADDRRDGFVHLSAAHQVAVTAVKHFAGRDDLMLLAVDDAVLGSALRWEPSRGGALFPHLYGPLPVSAVSFARPLALGPDGRHAFPDGVLP